MIKTAKTVRIIGNAPSAPTGISKRFDGLYIGLNSAPLAFANANVRCDICWVQDWRFFIEKRQYLKKVESALGATELYTLDSLDTFGLKFKSRTVITQLGRVGFSYDPAFGIYSGYTAAYGAMQLALAFKPERIELYGVDFTYGLKTGRFYQSVPGWDLDLHVHGCQIMNARAAIRHLNSVGVEVAVKTASLITDVIEKEPILVCS